MGVRSGRSKEAARAPGRGDAQRRGRRVLPALGLCLLGATLAPARAHGYAEVIHYEIARRALAQSGLSDPAAPIDLAAAAAVRTAIDGYARTSPALREAWTRRYPAPADFDAFAEKQLLQLAAGAQVFGIDRIDERLKPGATLLDLVALGARQPDDDWRNRERLAYDQARKPLEDARGKPVPADPAILNMGRLGALSSQAHAHYGLAAVEFSDDPDVLKQDPRRFAKRAGYERAPVITLAAEMAQMHLDLSLLAALSDAPTARELGWQYTGQGFHYLEDVGNQIHTVQVGLFDFFMDAFKERLKMGLLTGGGYLGQMRTLGSIGIDILTNHHTLSEHLTLRRFEEGVAGQAHSAPEAGKLVVAPTVDDPEFAKAIDAALAPLGDRPEHGEFALLLTRTLIEASSHEGDEVYRVTRKLALPKLRTRYGVYDETKDDPDRNLLPRGPETDAAYAEFFSLQERAFRRVGTALRRWVALEQKALQAAATPEARAALRALVLERLIKRQLRAADESDARLADYLRDPPKDVTAPERAPGILAAELLAVVLAVLGLSSLARRRRRRPPK